MAQDALHPFELDLDYAVEEYLSGSDLHIDFSSDADPWSTEEQSSSESVPGSPAAGAAAAPEALSPTAAADVPAREMMVGVVRVAQKRRRDQEPPAAAPAGPCQRCEASPLPCVPRNDVHKCAHKQLQVQLVAPKRVVDAFKRGEPIAAEWHTRAQQVVQRIQDAGLQLCADPDCPPLHLKSRAAKATSSCLHCFAAKVPCRSAAVAAPSRLEEVATMESIDALEALQAAVEQRLQELRPSKRARGSATDSDGSESDDEADEDEGWELPARVFEQAKAGPNAPAQALRLVALWRMRMAIVATIGAVRELC